MIEPPRVTSREIKAELERLYSHERRRHLVAFYGTGDEETIQSNLAGQFRVIPVNSELDLRERMPGLDEADARIAFLIPWPTALPLDLAGRFARNGKVFRIGKNVRLAQLFGLADVDDEQVRRSPLAEYLLNHPPTKPLSVPTGRLTLNAMWTAWLSATWGVPTQGGLALDMLLGWAAMDDRGPRFVEAMQSAETKPVRDALLVFLKSQLGAAGRAVWEAWEARKGRTALEYAVLFETLADNAHAGVRVWVKLSTRLALGIKDENEAVQAANALGRAAGTALRYVEQRAGEQTMRAIVNNADALVDTSDVREALIDNARLPSSWQMRLDKLGELLSSVAHAPNARAVADADQARRYLDGHSFFKDEGQTRVVKRAEMAVRLLSWLAARPDKALEGGKAPYADAETLARWYAEDGGFVDLARRWARGPADGIFGRGVSAILEVADQARLDLDNRFSRSLSAWIDATRPSSRVLPIDHALKRIAVRFLEEEPTRKLLVLLIDGMAWAQAVELLQSMAHRASPWMPLAWHASAKGRVGDGVYPTVLANLPTMTEVSRAAFFSGKPLANGTAGDTSKDVDRFRDHADLGKLLPSSEVPRLLLRGEGHTRDGSASAEALALVGDPDKRIVGIVINAIDASLKGDSQQLHPWTIDHVRSLPDLLNKAREAGRSVLLASDHGHVPADNLAPLPGASGQGGGARWRPWWSEKDPIREGEQAFAARPGNGVWAPRGAAGVVLLGDDTTRYGAAAHAGEHGGASLAEVVTPCLLIGCEDVAMKEASTDRGLAVRPAYVPAWWYFDVRDTPLAAPVVEMVRPKKIDDRQLALLPVEEAAPEPIKPAKQRAVAEESPFAKSEMLEIRARSAQIRKQVLQAVDFLLARNGAASDEAFAAGMGVTPYRVGGLVSRLQEVLNVDGYQVLRFDTTARQVYLDREKLCQQFEVKL